MSIWDWFNFLKLRRNHNNQIFFFFQFSHFCLTLCNNPRELTEGFLLNSCIFSQFAALPLRCPADLGCIKLYNQTSLVAPPLVLINSPCSCLGICFNCFSSPLTHASPVGIHYQHNILLAALFVGPVCVFVNVHLSCCHQCIMLRLNNSDVLRTSRLHI